MVYLWVISRVYKQVMGVRKIFIYFTTDFDTSLLTIVMQSKKMWFLFHLRESVP